VLAPRGFGTMAAMMLSGRLSGKVDPRLIMALGIVLLAYSLWSMTGWTPDVSRTTIVVNTVIQGAGLGFVFIPLQLVAFATLPAELRTDGTSLLSLLRNVGSAVGVSACSALLAHNVQVVHSELAANITPFNPALHGSGAVQMLAPTTARGAALLDQMINNQAAIIGYLDDFKAMLFVTAPAILLLLLMRRPTVVAKPDPEHGAALE
jgi:DHA2 family multidrug resistance protein